MTERQQTLWIIDGYNLIRRTGMLGESEQRRGSAVARTTLEALVRAFLAKQGRGHSVAIVYDGAPDPEGRTPAGGKALRILYPPRGRSADDVILDEARRAEGRFTVNVVTSDFHDIARRLRGLRVTHLSTEEFARRLKPAGATDDASLAAEKPKTNTAEERQRWLEAFGGDEPAKDR